MKQIDIPYFLKEENKKQIRPVRKPIDFYTRGFIHGIIACLSLVLILGLMTWYVIWKVQSMPSYDVLDEVPICLIP